MKKVLALLFAGAIFAAGCSGGDDPEPEPVDLFPPTTTIVSSTTTAANTTTTGAPTTTVPHATEDALADHALTFRPLSDSFSFENFGGGTAPADLTVNMARRLYGDTQVCSDVTDNKCTPYPVILQLISQANRSMQGGLCEGLAVLSLRLANDPATLSSFQDVTHVAALVKEDPALLSELAYWYVTQFAVEVQQEASAYLEMHPIQLAEILLRDFAAAEAGESSTGYTIGIYSEQGGHAVTPYRVEETESGYRIYIYDSNWPTSERWIDVDSGGWSYALAATNPTEEASAWGGGVGTMELTPMRSRSGPFSCGFCPSTGEDSGTLLTVASTGDKQMAIKIETEDGDRLGYYDGRFINEIEGATYRYLISGPSTADPVLVFLPPGVETFSADVEEIDVPTPTVTPESPQDSEAPSEQEPEEDTQKFSLLVLDEEKSVQIEATIVEEDPSEPETEEAQVSLIDFSEESVEIAEVEEATVAITVDALAIEIDLDEGQTIEVVLPPEPEPEPDPDVPVIEAPQMLDLSIQDSAGETLAEVAVDVTAYRVDLPPEPEPGPQTPEATIPPPPPPAPVVIEIVYDEEAGEITQEEEVIEAWVASDAEYYQAIVEDNLDEVLGESYVEELEEREEWVDEEEAETRSFLSTVLQEVDDEYWEDDHWEETSYDEEWFEEEYEEENWEEVEDPDEWFEEGAEEWAEEWAEEEEAFILEEMGLEEWDEDLMGPPLTETMEWEEEDWETYDTEMEAIWEEEFEDGWEEESEDDFWLDTEDEWDDWEEEFWPDDAEWCDDCEEGPWDEEGWDEPWDEEELWDEEPWDEELPMEDFTEWDDSWDEEESIEEDEEDLFLWDDGWDTEEDWDTDVEEEEDSTPPEEEQEREDDTEGPEPGSEEILEEEGEEESEEPSSELDPPGDVHGEESTDETPETEEGLEETWDNPYADCMGTSACENPPGGYNSWDEYEAENDPNWVPPPEPEEPEYVPPPEPPPPPPPVYWYDEATETWDEEGDTTLSSNTLSTTVASTATSILARGNDGHWYETITTETTTSVETQAVTTVAYTTYSNTSWCGGSQYDSSCGSTGAVAGNSYNTSSTAAAQTTATVTTAIEVVPASCSQGGFTGLGDWCIVDSSSRNDYDDVAFSVPTAAEENEACDCEDGDGLMDIRIDAETNLTGPQFNSNNEHADPYIYLRHDTDPDDGEHSGDTSEITVGSLIEADDDGGRDCGSTCNNPPSNAEDEDETPDVTLSNGEQVIENVQDHWDSRIERELSTGDYVVRASVYNGNNDGWYRLTIRDADVEYP